MTAEEWTLAATAFGSGLAAVRRRYFAINWIQFVTTWTALALFLVALALL